MIILETRSFVYKIVSYAAPHLLGGIDPLEQREPALQQSSEPPISE